MNEEARTGVYGPAAPALDLPGPSRRITVEPVETPATEPAEAPATEPPPDPEPQTAPDREPGKTPAPAGRT